jgi:hypothetical protein
MNLVLRHKQAHSARKTKNRVEQSWQGDFLFLARSFPWVRYAGAENRKGIEESF